MFSRRRGSKSQTVAPPSSSALTAASSAFLRTAPSQGSLSSAAAAAALRSHTTSPEPVGNLQTKRMVRRSSQSSLGSTQAGDRPASRGQLTRRDSNGSMSERTFRSPSPGRSPSRGPVPAAADAPPVPAVPLRTNGTRTNGVTNGNSFRRAASVEPPPQRVASPVQMRGGRGMSMDRAGIQNKRISSLPKLQELDREGSQRNVNFSRPMASPTATPPISPNRPSTAGGWFSGAITSGDSPRANLSARPKTSGNLSAAEVSGIQNRIQSVADKPVAKKTRTVAKPQEGSHLANVATPTQRASSAPQPSTNQPPPQPSITNSAGAAPMTPRATRPPENVAYTSQTSTSQPKQKPKVDTDIHEPPPRNPARGSPHPLKSARAAGMLHKQPSIVREDPEHEDGADTDLQDGPYPPLDTRAKSPSPSRSSSMVMTSAGPAIQYVAPTQQRSRRTSLEVPDPYHKSAHFANVVVDGQGVKHIPPPRSISPAKSALKHSPSSSLRTNSPQPNNSPPRAPPSDVSDTTSMASQDGINAGMKKKKSVRVSFDEDIRDAEPNSQSAAVRRPMSPNMSNDDQDETMRPRPALPSFGSVRNSASPTPPRATEKATETPPVMMSTADRLNPAKNTSSDHALGSFIAGNAPHQQPVSSQSHEPLPPEVTSVEGSGYHSDDSEYSQEDRQPVPAVSIPQEPPSLDRRNRPEQISTDSVQEEREPATDALAPGIPDINLLPATPGEEQTPVVEPEQAAPADRKSYIMPGGWGDFDEAAETAQPVQDSSRTQPAAASRPTVTISEQSSAPTSDRPSPQLDIIEESGADDSDASDAFSDAAEDPSEFEGGFASLDAVINSPMRESVARNEDLTLQRVPDQSFVEPGTSEAPGDWSEATAYWSSLSRQHKEQLEQQAASPPEKTRDLAVPAEKPKRVKKPAATNVQAEPAGVAIAPKPKVMKPKAATQIPPTTRAAQIAAQPQASEQPMRKSMRQSQASAPMSQGPEPAPKIRQSMRSSSQPRTTMRNSQPPPARPSSVGQQPQSALQKKSMRPASMVETSSNLSSASAAMASRPRTQPAKATPMPRPTDDSDSESSFKKKRRPSTSTVDSVGRYNMKRSMRAGSVDADMRRPMSPSGPANSGRWSIRSMSPPPTSSNAANIRQSLRSGSIDDTPTMRGQNAKSRLRDSKSPTRFSIPSFGNKAKPAEVSPAPAKPKSSFKSRLADSDDEDDGARPQIGFRSRFADSDDEGDSPVAQSAAMRADLTPVRGIPRRRNLDEGDSTDLDDSDNDTPRGGQSRAGSSRPMVPSQTDIEKAMAQARKNVAAMTGNEEIRTMDSAPTTPSRPAKKVTLQTNPSVNGLARQDSDLPSPNASLTRRKGVFGSIFGGRNKRENSQSNLPSSPASSRPAAVTTASTTSVPQQQRPASPAASQSTPRRGRLQRRNTPQFQRTQSGMSTMSSLPANPTTQAQAQAMNQKVGTPGSMSANSQNWPLPPPPKIGAAREEEEEAERPGTSDGVFATTTTNGEQSKAVMLSRPDIGRRSKSGGPGVGTEVDGGEKAIKKKRFGKLRKAFGI